MCIISFIAGAALGGASGFVGGVEWKKKHEHPYLELFNTASEFVDWASGRKHQREMAAQSVAAKSAEETETKHA